MIDFVRLNDVRHAVAADLYSRGWGKALGFRRFTGCDGYLQSIPALEARLLESDPTFPLLVLVDDRPSLTECLRMAEVSSTVVSRLSFSEPGWVTQNGPYWIRCCDGRVGNPKSPLEIFRAFRIGGVFAGLQAIEGVFMALQHPTVVADNLVLDLIGSHVTDSTFACLYAAARGFKLTHRHDLCAMGECHAPFRSLT